MAAASRTKLLAFCRSLPQTTEDIKWGNDLVFSVGAKMFACFSNTGKDASFSCKVPEGDFAAITSVDGIIPAPYAARYHWVAIMDPKVLPEKEALEMIRGSYGLVKAGLSQKMQRQIDGDAPAPKTKPKAKKKATAKAKTRKR